MELSCRIISGIALAACLGGCGGASTQRSSAAGASATRGPAGTSTVATTVPHPAPQDSFTAQISNATGRHAGAQDELRVVLAPRAGPAGRVRRLRIRLAGSRCSGQPRCLPLAGELAGRIVETRTIPDVGKAFSIAASGMIKPLGRVSAIGVVTGVGNARFGRESLRLTLSGAAGSLVLSGQSARLPAFSSP